ncbi:Na+/H+ antiporter NhaC family protein [Clostridium felsineum]|uniref:Na+/H+ antiporter NhaC family protein n=1 Tax=Clostridium felsineum TaxID=36839 RepID=UPI00214D2F07|nr:Na+/H+ antiporter NhaC family protein [Clostridium felsineum]MCR3759450.1 Na+/H+ antiporter NhaC family protein [Clostridium felsineum]
MEIFLGFLLSFFLLILSVIKNIFIGYALIGCWVIFALIAIKKGYRIKEIIKMSYNGGREAFIVIKILLIIGGVIGIWMASGTIASIVYYCLKFLNPSLFILFSFLICCSVSFLIGTSLGSISVVGIPLMIIARSGHVNLNIVAGAIIAGVYFGDRCSPMSSSAALVANLTKTNLFTNMKNMIYSSIIPFSLSLFFYYILSIYEPLKNMNNNLSYKILGSFDVNFIILFPAIIILILSIFKVKIYFSAPISILIASIVAVHFQHYNIKDVLQFIILGFNTNNHSSLHAILKGGGIVSMLKPSLVMFVSCSLSGIFKGINIFDSFKKAIINKSLNKHKLFSVISIVSIITAAFGCNQTISSVMTNEIMKDCYKNTSKYRFALDLENSGILIAALIPWNIAALVPTTTLNVSAIKYIPFAFYLYILPIVYFIYLRFSNKFLKTNLNLQ